MSDLLREYTGGSGWYYGYSGSMVAETFTIPAGYDRVDYFTLKLKKIGSPTGTSYGYLYATSGGIPTSELASAGINTADISTTPTFYTFDISNTAVSAGSRYALAFKSSGTSSGSTVANMCSSDGTNPYTDGAMFFKSSGSWSEVSRDIDFQVFGSLSSTPPTITGGSSSSVAETTATATANVTSDGGSAISARGFIYGLSSGNLNNNLVVAGTTGSFNGSLTNLPKGTTIYVKGYATNAMGTVYTSLFSFVTLADPPVVITDNAGGLQTLGATLNGRVTSEEGASLSAVGFVISKTATNNNPLIGGAGVTNYTLTLAGVASYLKTLNNLDPNTGYSYKIYATNAEGTTYGSVKTFTTLNAVAKYAQQITSTLAGTITSVKLMLKLASGTAGKPKLSIWSNNAGTTTPNAKLADLVLADITNSTFALQTANASLAVASGDVVWVQLEDILGLTDPANQYQVQLGSNSAGGYAGGVVKKQNVGSATWDAVTGDLAFEVNIQPTMTINYASNVFSRKRYR